ncbi:hypothetical protein FRC03_003427 [Tulasnella sp. 419]|nr:hypothetical protein FRC03_003427 [Tulasnella sp. 419]
MRLPLTSLIIVSSPVVSARLASIYSSSVTYCHPPDYILVQEFNARYYRYNSSLVFDLTVSSLRPDLNVTARIGLNAYGMEPVDLSFDLCELTKALCPLPKYNLSGAGTIPIPEFEDYIPGIAWIVPDLEAAAQLTLTRIETQEVVGCVQATLSNGHSLRQKSVGWAVGGLLLAMFSLSVIFTTCQPAITLLSESSAVSTLQSLLYQWMSLLTLCQTIVASALLHLNYPIAYRSYAVNFSWAFGLFHSSPNSALQRSMQHLREHTGSNSAKEGVLEPIEFVDRQMSPYNDISGLWKRGFEHHWHSKRQFIQPVTVTPEEVDRLQAGIPLYVNSIGIATGNSFLSVLYSTLILIGCIGVIAATGILLVWSFRQWQMRSGPDRRSNINLIMGQYWTGLKKIILRISYVGVMPIFTMAFYQWTIGDSWLAILLSVLLVVFVGCIIGYNAFALVRAFRNHGSNLGYLQAFHEPYRPSRWYYAAVPLFQAILKAVFISFARDSGLTQAIAFIIIDLSVFVLMVFSRPHVMSRLDIFEGFLYLVRLITSGLLIAFVESIGVKPIPRAIIAFVAVLVWSIGIVACFVNLLATLVAVAIEACALHRAGSPSKREGGEEELREVKKDVASPQISDKTFVGAKIMESPFEPSTMVFSEITSRASTKTDSVAGSLGEPMEKGRTELSEEECEYERPHSAYSIEGDLTSSLPTARLSAFGLLDTGTSSNPLLSHCGAQQSSTSIMMPNPPTDTPSPRTPTFDHVSATVGRLTPGYSSLGGRDSPHSAIVEGHMQLKRDADAIRRAQTSTPGTFGGRESPIDHFAS